MVIVSNSQLSSSRSDCTTSRCRIHRVGRFVDCATAPPPPCRWSSVRFSIFVTDTSSSCRRQSPRFVHSVIRGPCWLRRPRLTRASARAHARARARIGRRRPPAVTLDTGTVWTNGSSPYDATIRARWPTPTVSRCNVGMRCPSRLGPALDASRLMRQSVTAFGVVAVAIENARYRSGCLWFWRGGLRVRPYRRPSRVDRYAVVCGRRWRQSVLDRAARRCRQQLTSVAREEVSLRPSEVFFCSFLDEPFDLAMRLCSRRSLL